jgi:hypothetical protein
MTTRPDRSALEDAFLHDHGRLTRGLAEVLAALRKHDVEGARRRAETLDREAGAHIAFEEESFYPELRGPLGEAFVARLLDEHEQGRRALARLCALGPDGTLDEAQRDQVVAGLEAALAHALGCGTLWSRVAGLPVAEQQRLLDHLRRARYEGRRWTDRGPARDPDPAG